MEKRDGENFDESIFQEIVKNKVTKTGTTIVGLKYKTGVVLCADTRSTAGLSWEIRTAPKYTTLPPK